MDDMRDIQWFPGHMASARREIAKSLPLVDAVVEMLDARIPAASANPEFPALIGSKPCLVVLNKADMADEAVTKQWLRLFEARGYAAAATDSKTGRGVKAVIPALERLLASKRAALKEKGMTGLPIRAMILGIPNVGKSSLINRLAGAKRAKAEDRPGVTRARQWIHAPGLDLLDTPGVLWPKFDDEETALRLAFTGAIRDEILETEALAARLLRFLADNYPTALRERCKIQQSDVQAEGTALLEMTARNRGMLLKGAEADTERAAAAVLDEFRAGKFGRISLEKPENDI